MQAALALGQRGLGRVWPNPAVGCILVKEGRVVGRGWTQPGGRPHGEVMALTQAGDAAQGATAYVTLEPCAHTGKTPPCAQALIDARVARVVGALEDPDPRVSGRGFRMLEEAGITVTRNVCHDAALEAHAGFLMRTTLGRPLVTLKMALSADGRIATARGESRWITGPDARRRVHLLRATHDAVLIGAGTARADDPMLDIRDMGMDAQNPVRIVADGSLSLPLTGRLARSARQQPLWLCHRRSADRARARAFTDLGARTLIVAHGPEGELRVDDLLSQLGKAGITRLLCEGGGKLAATLLAAGLIDRLETHHAGLILGGDGLSGVAPLHLSALADAPRFDLESAEVAGPDMICRWRPR
ncbi:bifunctional diaminohydroxyphosphoribosylaminopyrimidine deaminase/5-amino-6-(5-phosphoribosylamino)uracil reductase RibD [Rhodobacteraceae bacterium KN286]|uniref:Riboflavin biosynthesis protein RibD n=2 Tax=Oceanomicrobium pacificus TaxID=2692916 RepID=A0A6B0U2L2_9RHOB|nr:bifunctional diaminohydroxyphosphoribosylaminopyrimidine deaminase/5-amino-6-(5-phosphoribosylamino)uracil reductase RibD [Oceanomicrobium pacificus]